MNYKPYRGDYLDFGGYVHEMQTDDRLIYLTSPLTADPITFHDIKGGADYQVPTGKKTRIIYSERWDTLCGVGYSDDADGSTNAVELHGLPTIDLDNMTVVTDWVPAGKYINKTGTAGQAVRVWALEVSA